MCKFMKMYNEISNKSDDESIVCEKSDCKCQDCDKSCKRCDHKGCDEACIRAVKFCVKTDKRWLCEDNINRKFFRDQPTDEEYEERARSFSVFNGTTNEEWILISSIEGFDPSELHEEFLVPDSREDEISDNYEGFDD